MSIVSALLGGSYINIVKEYIDKIFINEAKMFEQDESDIDIILRKIDGNIHIFIWSKKEKRLLRDMPDSVAEKILTR